MSFLSPEYANKVDNNLAGTSFDSRVALANDVTACLQASFKDNGNDFAIVLNDLEGGHTQGHNALLIGNDTHGYIYLSKDGVEDGISGNSLKGIKNHDNLNSFMSSSHGSSYDRFFAIVVTHDVAQNMIKDMLLEMHYPYNPFTSNCGQAVENVLLKNNNISVPSNLSPNFSFNYIIQNTKYGVLFQK